MRQNPHVRICGGPGSATTLVYPTSQDWRAQFGSAPPRPVPCLWWIQGARRRRRYRSSRLGPVTSWIIIALLVGIAAVRFVVTRARRSRSGTLFALGALSQTWIREQRSDKRLDP